MQYNVKMSILAEEQYDNILYHISEKFKNRQALNRVMDDYDDTIETLEKSAESFGYCNSERLRRLGFHKIHFRKHKYLFVYRISGDEVIVEGMYHELQDYENAIG
jgi:plasmid stabilization system protein ParE